MKLKKYLFILFLLTALLGCSNSVAWQPPAPCFFPDVPNIRAPGWICYQQSSSEILTAVGFAQSSRAGAAFIKKMALAQARVKLAQSIKSHCGVSYVKDVILINSLLMNVQRSPKDGLYVQVGVRPADFQIVCH